LINNEEREAIKCAQNNLNRGGEAFLPVEKRRLFSDLKRADKTNQAKGKTKYEHDYEKSSSNKDRSYSAQKQQ
jgi:hypothetical protein